MPRFEPIGYGSDRVPGEVRPYGNSLLITRRRRKGDENGLRVETPLVLVSFETDLDLQIDEGQLRGRRVYRPIRMAERMLNFSVKFPAYKVYGDGKRSRLRPHRRLYPNPHKRLLSEVIIDHWRFNMTKDAAVPMKLHYWGAKKVWKGYIERMPMATAWDDISVTLNLRMRLVTSVGDTKYSKAVGRKSPYAPTSYMPGREDVNEFGRSWYDIDSVLGRDVGGNKRKHRPDPDDKDRYSKKEKI